MIGSEEAFSQSLSNEHIVENYPQSTPMNVMYSDTSGNLGTTTDLGLQNLTVNGDSSFGGNVGVAGMIDTPSINRNSGDWLRINDQGASVGRTAMFGGVCINGSKQTQGQTHGGLSVGDWISNVGEGNIHATGKISAGGDVSVGGRISAGGVSIVANNNANWGMLWGESCALIGKRGAPIRFGFADNTNADGWSEKAVIDNDGNLSVHSGIINGRHLVNELNALRNEVNALRNEINPLRNEVNALNNNTVKYNDKINITNKDTKNHENHGRYVGFCGNGDCGYVNVILSGNKAISALRIERD
jgi:hypothetical protein